MLLLLMGSWVVDEEQTIPVTLTLDARDTEWTLEER